MTEPITEAAIRRAAKIIQAGGLVAFPTETVYGLGADAFNAQAVARIYAVKKRPSDNPMILHVENPHVLQGIVSALTPTVQSLIDRFWPGPLTLVMRKRPDLPVWVGGHPDRATETVGVRCPAHPAALSLIRYAGCPIAAPSANRAGRPSPTQATHVAEDFGEALDFLLDGGSVPGGLESTVLDVTGDAPVILRPGSVTADMLRAVVGVVRDCGTHDPHDPKAPGMKYRHYAPRAPMTVVTGAPDRAAAYIGEHIPAQRPGVRYGILATAQTAAYYQARFGERVCLSPAGEGSVGAGQISGDILVLTAGDRDRPETMAHALYACLRRFDAEGVDEIYAEGVSETGLGQAIMNRMVKAAGGRVV